MILRLQKPLPVPPSGGDLPGITIRPFEPDDFDAWATLRDAALAGLVAGGRPWTREDFDREFAASRVWVAVTAAPLPRLVGTIALGRAGRPPDDYSTLQWLMVDPAFRRRGIGRALVAVVERAAWDLGERRLTLETHSNWRDAREFYGQLGYAPVERPAGPATDDPQRNNR